MTIGIDFGTTKTVVSWKNPRTGCVEVVKCFGGDHPDMLLSVAYLRDDGSFVFGEDAELEALRDASGIRREFKLKLGDSDVLISKRIRGKKRDFNADEITVRFLEYVKKCCEAMPELSDCKFDSTVITVPVAFSISRREALLRTAEDAGFSDVRLELEPEAAAMAYMVNCPITAERAFLVDWGGGTLDLALVEKDVHGRFVCDHEYSQGMMDVGGETLDRNFVRIMNDRFRAKGAKIPTPDELLESDDFASAATAQFELTKSILRDKRRLDKAEKCTFYPEGRWCDKIRHAVDVNRGDYLCAIKAEVDRVCDLVREMVANMPQKPELLFLAGGTCESKVIQNALQEASGLKSVKWQDSRLAVALGAVCLNDGFVPEPGGSTCGENPAKESENKPLIVKPTPSRFRRFGE